MVPGDDVLRDHPSSRGGQLMSGLPTGTICLPRMPLNTPAAEVYQATSAVRTPTYPPNLMVPELSAKLPANRMISVSSRVRNTPNTAAFTAALHISMYVLKMAKA